MSDSRDWRLRRMSQAVEKTRAERQTVVTEDGSQANGERVITEQGPPKPKPPSDGRQRPPKPKPPPKPGKGESG